MSREGRGFLYSMMSVVVALYVVSIGGVQAWPFALAAYSMLVPIRYWVEWPETTVRINRIEIQSENPDAFALRLEKLFLSKRRLELEVRFLHSRFVKDEDFPTDMMPRIGGTVSLRDGTRLLVRDISPAILAGTCEATVHLGSKAITPEKMSHFIENLRANGFVEERDC